jgi:16S rRNA G966 N2-methylase RsmD
VRATTELARKAAFDILGSAIEGARVLDAAAGSGAYGLEAVSRGAADVTFVESDRRVLKVLKENIERFAERLAFGGATAGPDLLRKEERGGRAAAGGGAKAAGAGVAPAAAPAGVGDRSAAGPRVFVAGMSIASFVVSHLLRKAAFDVVFHDPPYDAEPEQDLSSLLFLLSPSGVLFHERGDDRRLSPGGRAPDDVRRYGTTRFLIFRGGSSPPA